MSSSVDLPPASILIGIPHILRAIIAACDSPTVAALARTSKGMREVINDDNPKTRFLHVGIQGDEIKRRVLKVGDRPKFVGHTRRWAWEDFFSFDPNEELQNTVLDLSGAIRKGLMDIAQKRGLFPNVVRIMAWSGPDHRLFFCLQDEYEVDYPSSTPPARSVVAFPFPFLDRWKYYVDSRSLWETGWSLFMINGPWKWVFDRVVYHPHLTTADEDRWLDENEVCPAILMMMAAWHTLFLIHRTSGSTWEARLLERVAYVSATALLRRTSIPGAHVTVVTDATSAITTLLHPSYHGRILQRGPVQPLQTVFREVVMSFLTNETLTKRTYDEEFTVEAMGALKFVSWAQYGASISPRQFELETIQ